MKLKIVMLVSLALLPGMLAAAATPEAKASADSRERQRPDTERQQIVRVDISYALFAALAEYQEFSEAEKQGDSRANAALVPVLESILRELDQEYARHTALLDEAPDPGALEKRLQKLQAYIQDFRNELVFRKKVMEFNALLEKQKTLIDQK